MDKRTAILLGVMTLVGGAMLADQAGMFTSLENFGAKHQKALDTLDKKIDKANDIIMQGVAASDQLEAFAAHSLPYDAARARSQYQGWLLSLVNANKLTQSSVDVSPAEAEVVKSKANGKKLEVYKRYRFSVSAGGTLEQITQFVFQFYQGSHLQKINTISLNPAGGGLFSISLSGEALGVPNCERKTELATQAKNRLAHDEFQAYQPFVRRNLFARHVIPVLKQVRLTSVTYDKVGQPEAWFQVSGATAARKLKRGEQMDLAEHTLEVVDIQPQMTLLSVDRQVVELALGQTVFDAQESSGDTPSPE